MCQLSEAPTISELTYMTAHSMAEQREQAFKLAFNKFFGHEEWTEEEVKKIATVIEYIQGETILMINGEPVLVIGPLITNVTIEGSAVKCSFAQSIRYVG